jgi:hypothetical protein
MVNIDTVGYYLSNYREIIVKGLIGSPLDLKDMQAKWSSCVELLDSVQKKEILDGKNKLDEMRKNRLTLFRRKIIRKFGLLPFQQKLLSFFIRRKHARIGGKIYKNVIEASLQTDYLLLSDARERKNK